jgi:hypothetical protein
MYSYKKYAMMGVSTVLLPLAKRAIQKLVSKATKKSKGDSAVEESEYYVPPSRIADRRT